MKLGIISPENRQESTDSCTFGCFRNEWLDFPFYYSIYFKSTRDIVALFYSRCVSSAFYAAYFSIMNPWTSGTYSVDTVFSYPNRFPGLQDLLVYRDLLLRLRNTHWNNKIINNGPIRIHNSKIFRPSSRNLS